MRLAIIGKFGRIHDEEYIARSFEMLGHVVCRVDERYPTDQVVQFVDAFKPDYVLWTKFFVLEAKKLRAYFKKYKTICWVFDLYWGHEREYRITNHPAFSADYVFTTDGGHDEFFSRVGIRHWCVRQGIYAKECFMLKPQPSDIIAFVGSESLVNPDRVKMLAFVENEYKNQFKWYGRYNTNEVRSVALNDLYSEVAIVVGDSHYSPHYWSNRVVETLGRGGFLIHQEVPGLKEEYPDIVTYKRGDLDDLKIKINYYLKHEKERWAIVRKNFEFVKRHYTMDKKCSQLLSFVTP
jgi:hypothetical protein